MLNLKDIFTIVQNELIDVSDTFVSISDCVFPDDAELTLKIKGDNVVLSYSEIQFPDDFNSDLKVTFKNIFMTDLKTKDALKSKIKKEILGLVQKENESRL